MDEEENTMMPGADMSADTDTPLTDDTVADISTPDEGVAAPEVEEVTDANEKEDEEDDDMPTMAAPSGE